jgi:hypothetical protein
MISNIPNRYSKKLMLKEINERFKDKFDFFYLPIDYNTKGNLGYAFINLRETRYIPSFVYQFHNKPWKSFNSSKICKMKFASI